MQLRAAKGAWQRRQRKYSHSLFVLEKQKGQIISLTSHKMTAERGEQILLFLSPALHFKSGIPAGLIEAKEKARKLEIGLGKAGHTGSWLLICPALIEVKHLHRSTANGLEFKSEMKILAEVHTGTIVYVLFLGSVALYLKALWLSADSILTKS